MWGPFILFALLTAVLILIVMRMNGSASESSGESEGPSLPREEKTLLETLSEDYLAANGGEETLDSLQSLRFSGTLETGGASIPYVSIKRRPNQSHLTLQFPDYKLSFVVDGESVWQRASVPGKEPVDSLVEDESVSEIRRLARFFDPVTSVLLLNEGTVENVTEGDWKDRPCYVLEFTNRDLDLESTAYIDPETMHVLARVDRLGNDSLRTLLFSEYKTIDGFQHAFKTETYVDDELENRVVIESAKHNVGAFSSFFEIPKSPSEER
jgi:hypothetical protein